MSLERRFRQSCFGFRRTNQTKWRFVLLVLIILWILYDITPNSDITSKPCRIPILNPWDKSMDDFLDNTTNRINCSKRYNLFFVDHNGVLQLNSTSLKLYNIKLTNCVYSVITRDGDTQIKLSDEIEFSPPIKIEHEVFGVTCRNTTGSIVYKYVHVNVMAVKDKKMQGDKGYEKDDQLSVIIIIIDSLSRSHALRSLPKSYNFLTNTLGAFDLKGYMKVGVNTFPNAVALLTGTMEADYYLQTYKLAHLDDMPFIWKGSSMRDYVTHLNEDMPNIATFTYHKLGFVYQPADYYYRLYALAMYFIKPIIVEPLENEGECYGDADHLGLQIEYFKRFLTQNTDRLKFTLFWNNILGHDNFNMMSRGDEPLLNLLQWLRLSGHLERSVLFFGSDHGFRMGHAGTTYIGRLENNLPLMTVRIPNATLKRFPHITRNLQYNTDKLTSPFDIYETIQAVVSRKFNDDGIQRLQNGVTRRNLFQKVPDSRSCLDAGIPQRYCACSERELVNLNNPLSKVLGTYCIHHLNELLKNYTSKCRPLLLHNITDIRFSRLIERDPPVLISVEYYMDYFGLSKKVNRDGGRYTVMFYTYPNKGLFEMMLDYKTLDNKDVKIIGDPIRVNVYGNESYCVDGGLLQQICLCHT